MKVKQTTKTMETMITLNFKTEKETENKVLELISNGIRFITTGRTQIIVFDETSADIPVAVLNKIRKG